MRSDVIYLGNALGQHVDMMNALHFGVQPEKAKFLPATPATMKAFFRDHNAHFRRRPR